MFVFFLHFSHYVCIQTNTVEQGLLSDKLLNQENNSLNMKSSLHTIYGYNVHIVLIWTDYIYVLL
jgi:hypothetical protein